MFDKYGSFLQWMLGHNHFDVLAIALPDEYFLIVLSMVVTGVVAVWRWDSIFPDRRDYANLVPLPISTRTIFLANLMAIFFVAESFGTRRQSCFGVLVSLCRNRITRKIFIFSAFH